MSGSDTNPPPPPPPPPPLPPAPTLSGWAFGSATPISLPYATPARLPRPQVPLGTVLSAPRSLLPRRLFPFGMTPYGSSILLNSGPRLHAVADPNAPAPVIPHVEELPQQITPAAADPPAVDVIMTEALPPVAAAAPAPAPAATAAVPFVPSIDALVHNNENLVARNDALMQQLQTLLQYAASGGSSGPDGRSNFLVPSALSGVAGYLGSTPSPSHTSTRVLGTQPPRPSGHAAKLPLPQSVTNISKFKDDPEALTLVLEQIFEHILRAGLQWPSDVRLFVTDLALSKWIKSYLEQAQTAFSSGQPFDQNEFISALVVFVTGEVRPRSVIALQEIMGHQITQGSDSAAQYSERFYQRSRLLSHIPPVVLCHHFIHGLRADLQKICCVDREGMDWSSLHALVQFTLVEERRLTLVSDSAPSDSAGSHHRKRWPQNNNWAQVNKKPKLAIADGAGPPDVQDEQAPYAAALQKSSGRPSSNRAVQPSSGDGAGPSGSGAGPSRLGPPSACPCFKLNNKGRPLAKWEQECLNAYGLCWYCKESSAHIAKNCPLKEANKKQ